ncbi:uncharacterized protein LOC100919640 [Sarcophilus harrisii]|uniref:MRG domain-containing protein n=1 Tax=Sarcophilus harrisii TaxID=9305 RepID=A0A7N4P673_SARHA|nr:uncharacterized protein LOC100919640 [Sarcophilus harrisii]
MAYSKPQGKLVKDLPAALEGEPVLIFRGPKIRKGQCVQVTVKNRQVKYLVRYPRRREKDQAPTGGVTDPDAPLPDVPPALEPESASSDLIVKARSPSSSSSSSSPSCSRRRLGSSSSSSSTGSSCCCHSCCSSASSSTTSSSHDGDGSKEGDDYEDSGGVGSTSSCIGISSTGTGTATGTSSSSICTGIGIGTGTDTGTVIGTSSTTDTGTDTGTYTGTGISGTDTGTSTGTGSSSTATATSSSSTSTATGNVTGTSSTVTGTSSSGTGTSSSSTGTGTGTGTGTSGSGSGSSADSTASSTSKCSSLEVAMPLWIPSGSTGRGVPSSGALESGPLSVFVVEDWKYEWVSEGCVFRYSVTHVQDSDTALQMAAKREQLEDCPGTSTESSDKSTQVKDDSTWWGTVMQWPCKRKRGRELKRGRPGVKVVDPEQKYLSRLEEVQIQLPKGLKPLLVEDWLLVTLEKKLFTLPARKSVASILMEYTTFQQNYGTSSKKRTVNELMAGLQNYFDVMLVNQLLYEFEKPQYADLMASYPTLMLSQIYGGAHLLRLFPQMGPMLACTPLSESSLYVLQNHLQDFLQYLALEPSRLFSASTDYQEATAEYQKRVG